MIADWFDMRVAKEIGEAAFYSPNYGEAEDTDHCLHADGLPYAAGRATPCPFFARCSFEESFHVFCSPQRPRCVVMSPQLSASFLTIQAAALLFSTALPRTLQRAR